MHTNSRNKHQYSASFKAPSKNANNMGYELKTNRFRSNIIDNDICDETWPLDEVINKIEQRDEDNIEKDGHVYNLHSSTWRSGPQLISDKYNSSRDIENIRGHGTIYSAFQQGSKIWKDSSVKHKKYKTKIQENSASFGDKYFEKSFPSYDVNNNYLDLDDIESNSSMDEHIPTLRDVGIQCNLKKFKNSIQTELNTFTRKKPPIKVIKSSNNGVVSTFSDVPKLSSPIMHSNFVKDFDSENLMKDNDVIYSQVDKSHKNRNGTGNINIVYKQPINEINNPNHSLNDTRYDIKSKEFGFNVSSANFPNIYLPNPLKESRISNQDFNENRCDKEILEETISICNSSSSNESLMNSPMKPSNQSKDNYSVTSKSSSNYPKEISPMRSSFYYDNNSLIDSRNQDIQRKTKLTSKNNKSKYGQDENVLLENNSLRLKSSKSPYTERLHKSNADLREQFLRDETRGGLAAAYKNRQQLQKNNQRQRALSLNRMNATIKEEEYANSQLPSRHLSQSHLNSRISDLSNSHQRGSKTALQHERDPIVMYIPPVNQRLNDSSAKLTSILRNNSTKSNVTLQSNKNKTKLKQQPKSQSKINLKEIGQVKGERKSSSDLSRRYSMPKDTKFNWFNKLKLKSK